MTDLQYDPNSVESLISKYLGGIRKPTAAQAGYLARVAVSATSVNLEYVDPHVVEDAVTGIEKTHAGPSKLTLEVGSEWVTIAFLNADTLGRICAYEVKIDRPPPYGYAKGSLHYGSWGGGASIVQNHTEFTDSSIRFRAIEGFVVLEVLQTGISLEVTFELAYWDINP